MYRRFIKRLLDIILSLTALAVLALPMLIIAAAVRLDSPGPALFRQKRVGIHKTYFHMLKFRTMLINAPHDMPTHELADPERYISRVGRFLRRTSCDELPQLLNILAGRMSIVGPRPALWNQDDLIAERESCGANDVLPGLTGWAQINGRDAISIAAKARLDGEYAAMVSFGTDVKCVLLTVSRVLLQRDVVEGAHDGKDVTEE